LFKIKWSLFLFNCDRFLFFLYELIRKKRVDFNVIGWRLSAKPILKNSWDLDIIFVLRSFWKMLLWILINCWWYLWFTSKHSTIHCCRFLLLRSLRLTLNLPFHDICIFWLLFTLRKEISIGFFFYDGFWCFNDKFLSPLSLVDLA